MKIVKTKEITPKDVSGITEISLLDFKDRAKLHDGSLPDFFVYIQDCAWNAFDSHGNNVYKETRCEAQGIFVGHYFKDQFGEFVVATAYKEGNGNSQSAYVEMSEECLSKISDTCQANGTLMLIWIHTHPGFGVFYSSTDYNCLKTNFYKPYQIGLVVDILKKQIKGFKTQVADIVEFADCKIFDEEKHLLCQPYENHKIKTVKKNEEKINELTAEIERLKKDLQSKEQDNLSLTDNLQQLKAELQGKQEQIEELKRKLPSKLEEIEQLRQNANSQKKLVSCLKFFTRKIKLNNYGRNKKVSDL